MAGETLSAEQARFALIWKSIRRDARVMFQANRDDSPVCQLCGKSGGIACSGLGAWPAGVPEQIMESPCVSCWGAPPLFLPWLLTDAGGKVSDAVLCMACIVVAALRDPYLRPETLPQRVQTYYQAARRTVRTTGGDRS